MSDLMFLVSPYLLREEVKPHTVLLLPFVNSVFIYFALVRDPKGEISTTILKCLPIVFLMMYMLLKGFELSKEYKTSRRILLGLMFSCAGDALLNIDLFPHGMGAFAVAQIFYISAFGWRPLKWLIGVAMLVAGAGLVALVFKNLDSVLKVGLPIYATLLLTMCWRAVARAVDQKDFLNVFCAFGSILFVLSDGLICIDMFLSPVPHARIWIMITYYIAQFAIAVSTAKETKYTKSTKKMSRQSPTTRIHQSEQVRRRTKSRD